MRNCKNWPAKCIICSKLHKVEEHQCGLINDTKSSEKICAHVTIKCANYGDDYMANSSYYTSSNKAGIKANKEKMLEKQSEKGKKKREAKTGNLLRKETKILNKT